MTERQSKTTRKPKPAKLITSDKAAAVASELVLAWRKYAWLFAEPPHGTAKQMAALLELLPEHSILREWLGNKRA